MLGYRVMARVKVRFSLTSRPMPNLACVSVAIWF